MEPKSKIIFTVFTFICISVLSVNAQAYSSKVFIEGLYTNILQRNPNNSEIEYWQKQIDNNQSATQIALSFYKSKEMRNSNLNSENFIKRAYHTFFDREADKEGLDYWKNKIDKQGYSREQIFYHFSFSKEFQKRSVKYQIIPYDKNDKLKAFTSRFYSLVFQRDSDDEGMNFWFEKLKNNETTPQKMAEFFFFSNEMKNRSVSNENFIKIAYRVFFDREADNEGLSFWKSKMDEKGKKWIIDAMMDSKEFHKMVSDLFDEEYITFLPPPENIKIIVKNNMAQISWNKVEDAISYKIYKSIDSNSSTDAKFIFETKNLAYLETDITTDKFYKYYITSVDQDGEESAFSDVIEVYLKKPNENRIILKTGQTHSFYSYDDAYYQKGADIYYTRDDQNGIVKDHTTNLMWQDNIEGGGVSLTQPEAVKYCDNLVLGGYDDWRLPSIEEMENLTVFQYASNWNYVISPVFKNIDSWKFWTTSKYIYDSNSTWVICYGQGFAHTYTDDNNYHTRCVRGPKQYLTKPVLKRDDLKEVVTEEATNLMWQDNNSVKSITAVWKDAVDYCENLNFAGFSDWRLPNAKELFFIADRTKGYPAIYSTFKNVTNAFYWSSTTYQRLTEEAWEIGFAVGRLEHAMKTQTAYIRCVRDTH